MLQNLVKRAGDGRIEVAFHDGHASLRLSGNVTLGEIAAVLDEVSNRYADRAVAIYVTLDGTERQEPGDETMRGIRLE